MTQTTKKQFEEVVNRYKDSFKKCNVTVKTLIDLQEHFIITEEYEKKEYGVVTESRTEEITAWNYCCVISGMAFFNDTIGKGNTDAGHIANYFFALNPWHENMTVTRKYTFTRK